MKRRVIQGLAVLVLIGSLVACSTVPITGRRQLNLMPESDLIGMSLTQYDSVIKTSKLSTDAKKVAMVKKVGGRIATAVETFLVQNGLQDRVSGFNWEFNLIAEDATANAWCMPGGKVVVYTGLLPYTQTEDGLAVVMGHEIAHAVARHGNERMSQQMGVQLGGTALAIALSQKPQQTQQIFMSAYGIGTQVGLMLPYSRAHETEADKMGLIFLAMAGYDPNASVAFWERMAQSGSGGSLELLSTHPSDQTRIANLKKFIPEAMKYYKKAE
jgi:predicted Zn-dependent protease